MKNNLRILMAMRKEKISDVKSNTGISRTTLHGIYYENTENPDIRTIMTLCDYFKVTPNEFLGIEPIIKL